MGKFVLKDVKVYYGGRDLSGELSQVSLEFSAETPDATAFGDNTRRRLPGVRTTGATHNGWWDSVSAADSLDADLFAKIGAASEYMSVSPDGGDLGEYGFSFKVLEAAYNPGGSHGEVFAFEINVVGDGDMIRGLVTTNAVYTTTTNGTITQVGAPAALETAFSTIHVVAASGAAPTVDVTVESDDAVGFGTPTVRMTHPQLTTVGSDQQSVVGPITDSFWRHVITITGGSPSFTIFGVIGLKQVVGVKNFLPPSGNLTISTTAPTVT